MLSFARSGETLLLKHLNAHPSACALYDLRLTNTSHENKIKRSLMSSMPERLEPWMLSGDSSSLDVAIAKTFWMIDRPPRTAFALIRNPLSIASSVVSNFSAPLEKSISARSEKDQLILGRAMEKLARIASYISPSYADISRWPPNRESIVLAVARPWTTYMTRILELGVPVVRYEDFVTRPETVLRQICRHAGLPYHTGILNAHMTYEKGTVGHGNIDLSRPIKTDSLDKFRSVLYPIDMKRVIDESGAVATKFGYELSQDAVSVSPLS